MEPGIFRYRKDTLRYPFGVFVDRWRSNEVKIIHLRFGYLRIFSYICINLKYMTSMNTLQILKETIEIDGTTYYHYTFGGKYNATKFVVINGIHYYNSNRYPSDEIVVR